MSDDTGELDVTVFRDRLREYGLEEDEIQTEVERAHEAASSGQVTLADALDEALKEVGVRMGQQG